MTVPSLMSSITYSFGRRCGGTGSVALLTTNTMPLMISLSITIGIVLIGPGSSQIEPKVRKIKSNSMMNI